MEMWSFVLWDYKLLQAPSVTGFVFLTAATRAGIISSDFRPCLYGCALYGSLLLWFFIVITFVGCICLTCSFYLGTVILHIAHIRTLLRRSRCLLRRLLHGDAGT